MARLSTTCSSFVRPRWLAPALVFAGLSFASLATAQTSTALSWVREPGAESCIAAIELGRRVERIVGPVLASAPEAQVSIEGRIASQGGGFTAQLRVVDSRGRILGERQVRSEHEDCRALDDQLAFVIAIAIDPDAALADLPGEFADDNEPGAELLAELQAHPPDPVPFARSDASRAAPRARRNAQDRDALGGGVSLGLGTAIGLLPDPAFGPAAEIALRTRAWSHRLRAVYLVPQTRPLDSGASVELAAVQTQLATCPELWTRPGLALSACLGAVATALAAEPRGFAGSARNGWIFGPTLEARWTWQPFSPLWLALGAGLQSLWPRHRVVYQSGGRTESIHRVPPLMGTAELSIELRF